MKDVLDKTLCRAHHCLTVIGVVLVRNIDIHGGVEQPNQPQNGFGSDRVSSRCELSMMWKVNQRG